MRLCYVCVCARIDDQAVDNVAAPIVSDIEIATAILDRDELTSGDTKKSQSNPLRQGKP